MWHNHFGSACTTTAGQVCQFGCGAPTGCAGFDVLESCEGEAGLYLCTHRDPPAPKKASSKAVRKAAKAPKKQGSKKARKSAKKAPKKAVKKTAKKTVKKPAPRKAAARRGKTKKKK
jgi:hypothetical protein